MEYLLLNLNKLLELKRSAIIFEFRITNTPQEFKINITNTPKGI